MTATLTRDDLLERLADLTNEAESLSRRGYIGTRSERYAIVHANINVVLTDLLGCDDH